MTSYVLLLRGINVGGKNMIPMADLRTCLQRLGYEDVKTYIASGNVIVRSNQDARQIRSAVEAGLVQDFRLDSELIKVLVLNREQLAHIIAAKPAGFGEQPQIYHSDVIFLIDISSEQAMAAFSPREGVDTIWPGKDVIYSQRLSAERTKSRLNKVMSDPLYKSMTIRNWNTTQKLLALVNL